MYRTRAKYSGAYARTDSIKNLVYSRTALDPATTPNDSAVLVPASIKVGADQGTLPTSGKTRFKDLIYYSPGLGAATAPTTVRYQPKER